MRATKIGLLFLILAFGSTVETAWRVRNHVGPLAFGPTGCRVLQGNFQGPSFDFTEERKEPFSDGGRLEVTNAFGAVRVFAGEPGQVAITLRKVVYRPTQDQAARFAPRVRMEVQHVGDTLRLGTTRDAITREGTSDVGFETHFEIAVPPETRVKVASEHGRVEVADVLEADLTSSFDAIEVERVRGPVVIKGRHGAVSASMVRGTLEMSTRHGDATLEDVEQKATVDVEHGRVSAARVAALLVRAAHGDVNAETVNGDLGVEARHSHVRASDVTGAATVETSFGPVELRRVGGDARVRVRHGRVEVAEVAGGLDLESSFDDVHIEGVHGPVHVSVERGGVQGRGLAQGGFIRATGGDIVVDAFEGALEVQAERAAIVLRPAGPLTGPLRASTRRGGIELAVPPGSGFVLKASAERGGVTTDVPGLVLTQTGPSRVEGQVGEGGREVVLSAHQGDVKVHAAAVVARTEAE